MYDWTDVDPMFAVGDAEAPKVGTVNGPGRAPGALKPGRRRRSSSKELTPQEKREQIQRRIAKDVARDDERRRCMDLRRVNYSYSQIAAIVTAEYKAKDIDRIVTADMVAKHCGKFLAAVRPSQDVRMVELDKLESAAAELRKKLDWMTNLPEGDQNFDLEVYAKVAETYLKYRERVSKLLGLDAAVKQQISRDGPPQPGGMVHVGPDGVTIRMPGSLDAYEDWVQLSEKGLIGLASDVIELAHTDHTEAHVVMAGPTKAGVTLRADADCTPGAERPRSALEALDRLGGSGR